jgi:UDP-N-acetylglucosamine 4,6-dehydratase/5-epimerase
MTDASTETFNLKGKSILVTGGTGSFGREFVARLLATSEARRVIVFSRDEQKQFQMSNEAAFRGHDNIRFFIGDVRDRTRLEMATRDVDYIVHAAAMKHVAIAEYNPVECVHTNVTGAENIVHAAIQNKVRRVIALSTDKACNPINLYGASKLASDKIFVAANNMSGSAGTRFSVVRYGNVMGSRGSVLPLFQELVAQGVTALPITDERMTRFWITLDQGVEFVLSCFDIMRGGEIFVPKIPSMRVVDLARALAPDLPHDVVGVRPGEKLHEAMVSTDDARLTVDLGDRYVIEPALAWWDRMTYVATGASRVADDFSYTSDKNERWLSAEEMLKMAEVAP